jgi:hypothetical protein
MTIREAINALPFEIEVPLVEKTMIEFNLEGNASYTADNVEQVEMCIAELCRVVVTRPDYSEGKTSVKQERAAIMKYREGILRKYNSSAMGGLVGDHSEEPLW